MCWYYCCVVIINSASPPHSALTRRVNLVQNVGVVLCTVQGVWGTKSPEAEAILDFYMHNFDLILNYFSKI